MGNNLDIKKSCEKPKIKPEIADTFNWSKEERKNLKEELLVGDVRKKLIAKYPEQKCFFESAVIKLMQLGKTYQGHQEMIKDMKRSMFLLYSPEGKLLSYLDQNGNTLFDISNFNFDDDFANLLNKKIGNPYVRKNQIGVLEIFDPEENKIHKVGGLIFNSYIFAFYLPKF